MKTTSFLLPILLIHFLFLSNQGYAQQEMPSRKEAESVNGRTVIVQIETPNSKVIEKLQKKGKEDAIAIYEQALDDYNTAMKAVVAKYWKFSDKVLYKTPDEIADLIDLKDKSYAILRCATSTIPSGMNPRDPLFSTRSSRFKYDGNLDWSYTTLKHEDWQEDRDYWNGNTIIELWKIESLKKGIMKLPNVVCRVALPELYPDTASLVYGVVVLQSYLNRTLDENKTPIVKQIKADAVSVKTKTLCIRKDRLDPELTKTNLKEFYPYTFKILEKKEFESAAFNGDSAEAFLLIAPVVTATYSRMQGMNTTTSTGAVVMYYTYVLDVNLGRTIATIAPPLGSMFASLVIDAGRRLSTQKLFKMLSNQISLYDK